MVVVKAYIKMDPLENLAPVEACLSKMAKALDTRSCPNVLPYQRWLQSNVSLSSLSTLDRRAFTKSSGKRAIYSVDESRPYLGQQQESGMM